MPNHSDEQRTALAQVQPNASNLFAELPDASAVVNRLPNIAPVTPL